MDNKPNFELPRSLEDLRISSKFDHNEDDLYITGIKTNTNLSLFIDETINFANFICNREVKYLVTVLS